MPRIIETRSSLSVPMATPNTGLMRRGPVAATPVATTASDDGGDTSLGDRLLGFLPGGNLLGNLADWATELARTLRLLGVFFLQLISPAFWIRLFLFGLGAVMIIGGTWMFAKG